MQSTILSLQLLPQLPLPLAQTLRRAVNAKSAENQHLAAYYVFESSLKLAAAVQVGVYRGLDLPDQALNRQIEALIRPSTGHWLGILRDVAEYLDGRVDSGLLPCKGLHQRLTQREDRPALAAFVGFAAKARSSTDGRTSLSVLDLFETIVNYRNKILGHGAQRKAAFYREAAPLLLEAVATSLRDLDPLSGMDLVVARERLDQKGEAKPIFLSLRGDGLKIPLELESTSSEVQVAQLAMVTKGHTVPLHPLVVYEVDENEGDHFGFLNGVKEKRRRGGARELKHVDYLDYDSGGKLEWDALHEVTELFTKLRGVEVTPDEVRDLSQAEGGPPSDRGPAEPGETLGDFDLVGELGRGGMGIVYLARQESLGRTVALKVLPPGLARDPVAAARFKREVAALGRCDHPNVVKVFMAGRDGDRTFYAMEYVEGADLEHVSKRVSKWNESKQRITRGDLIKAISTAAGSPGRKIASERFGLPKLEKIEQADVPEVASDEADYYRSLARLLAGASEGLHHLHERGIVHRDIKPGNIVLTADGARAVILDLGLAQLKEEKSRLTASSVKVIGTLRYMPPEQLQRKLFAVTHKADIYSLGATLYELTTFRPMHDGETEQRLITQILNEDPLPPRSANSRIPADLATIIRVATARKPEERYPSAEELAEDLRRFAKGEPIQARAPGAFHYLGLFYQRNARLVRLAGVAAMALVALTIGFLVRLETSRQEAERARDVAQRQEMAAEQARLVAEKQQGIAERQTVLAEEQKQGSLRTTYRLYKDKFQHARGVGRHEEAAAWLRAAIGTATDCDLPTDDDRLALVSERALSSRVAWRRTPAVTGLNAMVQAGPEAPIWASTISFAGRERLLVGRPRGADWEFEALFDHVTDVGCPQLWGDRPLVALDGQLVVLDPASGEIQRVLSEGVQPGTYHPPGSESVFAVVGANQLVELNLANGAQVQSWALDFPEGSKVYDLVVETATRQAVLRCTLKDSMQMVVYGLNEGAELLRFERAGSQSGRLRLGVDRCAVYTGSEGEVTRIALGDEVSHWRRETPWSGAQPVLVSAEAIDVLTEDGMLRRWSHAGELLGQEDVSGPAGAAALFDLPSGRWLAGAQGLLHFAEPGTATPSHVLPGQPSAVGLATWDADRLVCLTDSHAEFRSTHDGHLLDRLPLSADAIVLDGDRDVLYARDGETLSSYDPSVTTPLATNEDAGLVEGPLLSMGEAGLIATRGDGVWRFDAHSLARRERIHWGPVSLVRALDDEVFLVVHDADRARLEVWTYSLGRARLRCLAITPLGPSPLTSVEFAPASRELFWGTDSGDVFQVLVPAAAGGVTELQPQTISSGGEDVTVIARLGQADLLIGRDEGALERFSRAGPTSYLPSEPLEPFWGTACVEVLAVSEGRCLGRTADGNFGLLELRLGHEESPQPGIENAGWRCDVGPHGFAYPMQSGAVFLPPGQPQRALLGREAVSRVRVSPDGALLVTLGAGGELAVYNPDAEGEPLSHLQTFGSVQDMEFVSADQVAVISGASLARVSLTRPREPKVAATRTLPGDVKLKHVACAGARIAAASEAASKLYLFDRENLSLLGEIDLPGPPWAVAPGPGDWFLVGGQRRVWVVDPTTASVVHTITVPRASEESSQSTGEYYVRALCMLPGQDFVAIGGRSAVFLARLGDNGCFQRLGVGDYVWRLEAHDSTLFWASHSAHGRIDLPRFAAAAEAGEGSAELHVEEGELHTRLTFVAAHAEEK